VQAQIEDFTERCRRKGGKRDQRLERVGKKMYNQLDGKGLGYSRD